MATISWKSCYETGIKVLDAEHQGLVEQINRLFEAIRQKNPDAVLLPIFDALVEYSDRHFIHEEELMAQFHYPGLAEQQREHQELRRKVVQYREKLLAGTRISAGEVMQFLRGWLLDHIVEHDLRYGPYLESRGGRFLT